jgi:transcriptional regulator with XRE-family HTH domain
VRSAKTATFGMPDDSIGEVIARFRRRLRQPETGSPWSQEDLALEIGTDQAHISRIEGNQKHPNLSTLAHICDALKLSQTERTFLLARAGYRERSRPPNSDEVGRVLEKMVPILESFPYPTTLIDDAERIWHFNTVGVGLWGCCFGIEEHDRFLAFARGKRYIELVLDPRLFKTWKTFWGDVDGFLHRLIALYWRAYCAHARDAEMRSVFDRLIQNPEFSRRWETIEQGDAPVLFVEYSDYLFHHPQLGGVHYNTWRTHPAIDERFIVTHCTPTDTSSATAFEFLARTVR